MRGCPNSKATSTSSGTDGNGPAAPPARFFISSLRGSVPTGGSHGGANVPARVTKRTRATPRPRARRWISAARRLTNRLGRAASRVSGEGSTAASLAASAGVRVGRRLAEQPLRCHLRAADARAELGDVEVEGQDAVLGQQQLQLRGQPGFQELAEWVAAVPEEQVLHGDGAGTPRTQARPPAVQLVPQRLHVEAVVATEAVVLRGNHGGPQRWRDGRSGARAVVQPVPLRDPDQHQRGERRIDDAVGQDDDDRDQQQGQEQAPRQPQQPPAGGCAHRQGCARRRQC